MKAYSNSSVINFKIPQSHVADMHTSKLSTWVVIENVCKIHNEFPEEKKVGITTNHESIPIKLYLYLMSNYKL